MKIGDKVKVVNYQSVFYGEVVELVKETDTAYFFTNEKHKRGELTIAKDSVDGYIEWENESNDD